MLNRALKRNGQTGADENADPVQGWNVQLTLHDDGASARWAPRHARRARNRTRRRHRKHAATADRGLDPNSLDDRDQADSTARFGSPVLAAPGSDEDPMCPAVGCAASAARFICDNEDLLTRARVASPRVPRLLEIELSPDTSGLTDLALWLDRYGGVLRAQTATDPGGISHRIADLVFHHCCLRVEITARVPIIEEHS